VTIPPWRNACPFSATKPFSIVCAGWVAPDKAENSPHLVIRNLMVLVIWSFSPPRTRIQ
jgi:hypothetical protein